jgi:integrase/recombinase XerD
MTPLRAKMMHQLQLHRLAPRTQKAYVRAVEDLARFYWRAPDQLIADEIRDYLHHLLVDRQLTATEWVDGEGANLLSH